MQQKRTPSVTRVSAFSKLGRVVAGTPQRAPVISRHRLVDPEAVAASAQQLGTAALSSGTQAAKTGVKSGLRFWQFLRAYMRAFAVGMAGYLLVTELANGHFNIIAMIGMHLFSIIAAPFYALMLAPAIFGLYNGLSATGLRSEHRAYAVGSMLGLAMLVPRITSNQFLIAGDFKQDALAVGVILCGLSAGYVFNQAVARIVAADADVPVTA